MPVFVIDAVVVGLDDRRAIWLLVPLNHLVEKEISIPNIIYPSHMALLALKVN